MTQSNTTTRKLGANRGATRLWLEGAVLTNAGFNHRDQWLLTIEPGKLVIIKDYTGVRMIAGTVSRPIIDINAGKVLQFLGNTGDTVEIANPRAGMLVITKVAA